MPIYEYRGLNRSGRNVKGNIDADTQRTARSRLKKDGIYVVSIKDKTKSASKKKGKASSRTKVGVDDLAGMTRQLATLLKSNIPLVEALSAISDQVENPNLKDIVSDIKTQVNEGGNFHKALAKYPRTFNSIYVSMCEAGEASGTLDLILLRLAEFTEAQNELSAKVRSALAYPVVIVVFIILMLFALFIFVIPQLRTVFESGEVVLPWYTELVFGFSEFLVEKFYWIIFGTVTFFLLFKNWKNSPSGSKKWDRILLTMPIFGPLLRMLAVSRFARTLSTLLNGGVAMLTALEIVKNVVNNQILSEAIDAARDNIREGESVAGPLKKSGQFPPLVIHMISTGEKTGDLENMLEQVANAYDFQVKTKISGMTSMIEPLMIVVMGIIVGFIVFSVMIPLFEMGNVA